jgi:hypothetical protein
MQTVELFQIDMMNLLILRINFYFVIIEDFIIC